VDWREFDTLDSTTLVNGLANDVHDTTKNTLSDRDLDWGTNINDLLATDKTFNTIHGNGSNSCRPVVNSPGRGRRAMGGSDIESRVDMSSAELGSRASNRQASSNSKSKARMDYYMMVGSGRPSMGKRMLAAVSNVRDTFWSPPRLLWQ
jgi:hypothetical protein